jgi:coenzyme F420-0:L-glutamate ligase/coenzyme F420-1:gamma-L-glutamate ligase
VEVAVVIGDSDRRHDRRGATVTALGAAGIAPIRIQEKGEPWGSPHPRYEGMVDMIAAACAVISGQTGRGAPVVILRGVGYVASDEGVLSTLLSAS